MEQEIKQKIERFKNERENLNKGHSEQKVEMENQKVMLAEQKLKQLEARESAILERLKNT